VSLLPYPGSELFNLRREVRCLLLYDEEVIDTEVIDTVDGRSCGLSDGDAFKRGDFKNATIRLWHRSQRDGSQATNPATCASILRSSSSVGTN